tara:strand:- start:535 stop:792 length:258 start_codon:yes stop_codon:yes gene_type:complete
MLKKIVFFVLLLTLLGALPSFARGKDKNNHKNFVVFYVINFEGETNKQNEIYINNSKWFEVWKYNSKQKKPGQKFIKPSHLKIQK